MPKGARLVGQGTAAAPHRSGDRTPAGADFRLWVKTPSLCSPRGLALSGMGQGLEGFLSREKPGCILLMKNGGVRSPPVEFFLDLLTML